jgi:hypothetical protein
MKVAVGLLLALGAALTAGALLPLASCGQGPTCTNEDTGSTKAAECGCAPLGGEDLPATCQCLDCFMQHGCGQITSACNEACGGDLECGSFASTCPPTCDAALTQGGLPCADSPAASASALDNLQNCAAVRCRGTCAELTVFGPVDGACTACLQTSCAMELQACEAQ